MFLLEGGFGRFCWKKSMNGINSRSSSSTSSSNFSSMMLMHQKCHSCYYYKQSFSSPRILRSPVLRSEVNHNLTNSSYGFYSRKFHYDSRSNPYHPITVHPEDPDGLTSRLKSPYIPEGHPVDSDGKPLGLFIPDYDVELPAFSHRGFTKDFQTWVSPPRYPLPETGSNIKYDYQELQTTDFPPVYEINLLYVIYALAGISFVLAVVGTHIETGGYYAKYGEFYKTGWPMFHYEPLFDIVPLTARTDGKPPEALRLVFQGEEVS